MTEPQPIWSNIGPRCSILQRMLGSWSWDYMKGTKHATWHGRTGTIPVCRKLRGLWAPAKTIKKRRSLQKRTNLNRVRNSGRTTDTDTVKDWIASPGPWFLTPSSQLQRYPGIMVNKLRGAKGTSRGLPDQATTYSKVHKTFTNFSSLHKKSALHSLNASRFDVAQLKLLNAP